MPGSPEAPALREAPQPQGGVAASAAWAGAWREHPLCDAHFTHQRLEDPVRVVRGGVHGPPHSRANLVRRLPGGNLFVPGGPYAAVGPADVVDDPVTAALLLAHPSPALQAILWEPAQRTEASEAAAETLRRELEAFCADLRGLSADAFATRVRAAMSSCEPARRLGLVPALQLMRALPWSLTLGADGLTRLYTGPVECSANAGLYDPIARCNEQVDPHRLAADIANLPAPRVGAGGRRAAAAAVVDTR